MQSILHIQHDKWFLVDIWVKRFQQHFVWHHLRKVAVNISAFLGKFFTYSITDDFWQKSEFILHSMSFYTILQTKEVIINIFLKSILHIQHYKWFLVEIWVHRSQHVLWHNLRILGVKIHIFSNILHIVHYKWSIAEIWVYRTQHIVWHHLKKEGGKDINIFLQKKSSHTALQMISCWNLSLSYWTTCRMKPF